MHAVTGHELTKVLTEFVVGIGGHVVELVHCDQPVVEFLDAVLVHSEAERGVGTNQHLVVAFEEGGDGFDLPAVVPAWRVAEVPPRLDVPVGLEAVSGEGLVVEA